MIGCVHDRPPRFAQEIRQQLRLRAKRALRRNSATKAVFAGRTVGRRTVEKCTVARMAALAGRTVGRPAVERCTVAWVAFLAGCAAWASTFTRSAVRGPRFPEGSTAARMAAFARRAAWGSAPTRRIVGGR